jgi:dihydroorotate dehydrogenase (NAD+) catalytic subunit
MSFAIELAPNWKRSLTLTNPLMLAVGGYTDFFHMSRVGAIVTLPVTLQQRAGAPPHIIEIPCGVLMRTGAANPGLAKVLHDYRRVWAQSAAPIIVAFAAQGLLDWPAMAARLERVPGVGGIELHLNPTLNAAEAVRATRKAIELPILAKLDLENARDIAAQCIAAGANALVIGRAPRGMAFVDGRAWYGRLFGPAVKPIALRAVAEIAEMKLSAPLIACGGVHSTNDAREFLAAGACAVEMENAQWVDPQLAMQIAAELQA